MQHKVYLWCCFCQGEEDLDPDEAVEQSSRNHQPSPVVTTVANTVTKAVTSLVAKPVANGGEAEDGMEFDACGFVEQQMKDWDSSEGPSPLPLKQVRSPTPRTPTGVTITSLKFHISNVF